MTFSLVAKCEETGMFGTAVTSSSPAVAARCSYTRSGVGAVSSQNITDPSLGNFALDLLEEGLTAKEAIAKITKEKKNLEFRQILIIDGSGQIAIHSGNNSLGIFSDSFGKNVLSAGNLLANKNVTKAVVDKFENTINEPAKFNVGRFDPKEMNVGTGMVGAPACGDVMKLQIKVENNKIVDAKFKTFGCGSAIASSSLATEWVKGKSIDEAMAIQNTEIVKELSLPPVKIHCSVLAEDAIKAAISDYKNRKAVESP